jgi:hypothetical protein
LKQSFPMRRDALPPTCSSPDTGRYGTERRTDPPRRATCDFAIVGVGLAERSAQRGVRLVETWIVVRPRLDRWPIVIEACGPRSLNRRDQIYPRHGPASRCQIDRLRVGSEAVLSAQSPATSSSVHGLMVHEVLSNISASAVAPRGVLSAHATGVVEPEGGGHQRP